jgi:hypothetical protein
LSGKRAGIDHFYGGNFNCNLVTHVGVAGDAQRLE